MEFLYPDGAIHAILSRMFAETDAVPWLHHARDNVTILATIMPTATLDPILTAMVAIPCACADGNLPALHVRRLACVRKIA